MKKNKNKLNLIDQRIFKYWQALFMAFYSRRLYIDVAKRWRGFGLMYFLMLILIASIPASIKVMYDFSLYYDTSFLEPLQKMPSFAVDHGKLNFDYFMPYEVKNSKGDTVIIFDNKNSINQINYIYPNWMLFIANDRMYYRSPKTSVMSAIRNESGKEMTMQPFEGMQHESFEPFYFLRDTHFASLKWYFIALVYPLLSAMLFGFFAMFLVFMSSVGKICSIVVFKHKIKFKEAYRLMAVASGSCIGLFILTFSMNQHVPFIGFYLLVAIILYFCFAILTIRRESKGMVLA
ncbi:MAG: DUF1189 domain-containing protein [Gammaproteobacteria bacterium]|nr:DUF1189 domain-containing protein [Gammaproteobacteria bacterium]